MILLDADAVEARLDMGQLIDALAQTFRETIDAPERQVVPVPGGPGRLLLAMPAFAQDGGGAVKLATVFPDNRAAGLPTIHGLVLLFGASGEPVAIFDGGSVTHWRTAAASALASRYLSRRDSRRLLVIGTGALAPYMALAHACVRPIESIEIWGRDAAHADQTVERVRRLLPPSRSVAVRRAADLPAAVAQADIVSCATSAETPVLKGDWLREGSFVDLVGNFSPEKRECDDATVRRAALYVDTFEGALSEAGDLLGPLARGVITRGDIRGDLAGLVTGSVPGRATDVAITLFKSVGTAIEDLAAARLLVGGERPGLASRL